MDTPLTATTTDAVMAESTTVDTLNSEDAMETEAPVQQQQAATATTTASSEEEDHALRHTKPRFDYAIGKDVQDHHFTKAAKPLTAEEAARVKALGFNNPAGATHHTEGFISHSAQRALLRSLDHANNTSQAQTAEMAELMREFDALVQECGSIKARLEHEHYKTAVKDTADLHTRLIALQGAARHALLRAEREAALWRGAEHKREVMHQHAHEHEGAGAAAPAAAMPVGGED